LLQVNKRRKEMPMKATKHVADETGAIGYILAWLLGVPATVLFAIFLVRGCT
jgi:hypothetical protein